MSARRLPSLDMHAHIDLGVSALQLEQLGAVVFAATRTPAEFESVKHRGDLVTVWGLGCHPRVVEAFDQFSEPSFRDLVQQTAFVGEVGIDGGSIVSLDRQREALHKILGCVQEFPRIVSLHSARATRHVIECVENVPVRSPVLHWWLGTPQETQRAVQAGCYFSVNSSMIDAKLAHIPLERILTETDHPFGNKSGRRRRQPGAVDELEERLAMYYGLTPDQLRVRVWKNLARIVDDIGVSSMLSVPLRRMLAAAKDSI